MKRFILLYGCLLAAFTVGAQPTLDECRRLAREHYPEIRQYDLIRQTEAYTLSNANKAWLPQISLGAQATWQTDVATLPSALTEMLAQQGLDMPGINKDQYKIALELNQIIWDGGKTNADKQIAKAEATEQSLSTEVNLYSLESRVDNLYFGILLLDQNIAQTNLTIELLQSNLDKVRSLQKNGVAMQADADAVEAELLAVGQQRDQLEASRNSYRRMLEIFIGKSIKETPLIRPDITEPTSFDNARPELVLFDAKINKLIAQEKLIKSSTRPRFGLFAQGYYGYPGMDYFESMMNTNWSWNAMFGVKMSWNFGAYYTRKNSLNKIRTAQRQVNVQRDVFLFNTQLQTTEGNGNISRLRKALVEDERIVRLRRSVREAAESKLQNGVIDTNDLLRKITEEATAATARFTHEIELVKAIYELKHTINQ